MNDELSGFEPPKEKTLREMLDVGISYMFEMLRSWKLLLIFMTLGAAGYWAYYYLSPPDFTAKLTFMVDDDDEGVNPLSSVLGLIGAGGGGGSSPDKILELAKSRNIVSDALFERTKVGDKVDFFANHIIRIMKYHKVWEDKSPDIKDFYFTTGNVDSFDRKENRALLYTYAQIIGNVEEGVKGYLETKFSETSGIMTLSMKTENEELSISFLRTLFDRLETFYKTKSVEKQYATYKLVTAKRDSIKRVLDGKEYSAATFQDQSFGLLYAAPMVKGKLLQRDIRTFELLYAEAVKNSEVADFSLKSKMPYVQPIDLPIGPIKPGRPTVPKALVIGAILGAILGTIVVLIRRILKNAYAMPVA